MRVQGRRSSLVTPPVAPPCANVPEQLGLDLAAQASAGGIEVNEYLHSIPIAPPLLVEQRRPPLVTNAAQFASAETATAGQSFRLSSASTSAM
jgi:hypothetical protein